MSSDRRQKSTLYESVQQFRSHKDIDTLCDHLLSDRGRQIICHFLVKKLCSPPLYDVFIGVAT